MNFKQESSWAKNIYENKNEVMVSILCITYNQETYIEDAINSFLMQIQILNMKLLYMMMRQQIEQPKLLKRMNSNIRM